MQLMVHVIQMLDCYTRICFSKLWIPSTMIAWTYTFKCVCKYICSERKHDLSLDTVGKEKLKKKASDFEMILLVYPVVIQTWRWLCQCQDWKPCTSCSSRSFIFLWAWCCFAWSKLSWHVVTGKASWPVSVNCCKELPVITFIDVIIYYKSRNHFQFHLLTFLDNEYFIFSLLFSEKLLHSVLI